MIKENQKQFEKFMVDCDKKNIYENWIIGNKTFNSKEIVNQNLMIHMIIKKYRFKLKN